MKFSVGVEYAIHCLLYMVNMEDGKSIGIRVNVSRNFGNVSVKNIRKIEQIRNCEICPRCKRWIYISP